MSSSEIFMVPISAAKADPLRPVATMATISGPSSRRMVHPMTMGRKLSAPYLCDCTSAWYASTTPISVLIMIVIGSPSGPQVFM